jgi:heptosyltransferase-1
MEKEMAAIKSLLVVKPSSLGDIVHALQVLQGVAAAMPDCRITWVARDRFAPLVEAAPFVHEVIHFRRKEGLRGIREILAELRGRRFDMVWDMQGLFRSALMASAPRSLHRWGRRDSREAAWLFYGERVALPPGNGPHHAIPVLQEFPKMLGLDGAVTFPLGIKNESRFGWENFFDGPATERFVIFTDSRGAGKEWRGFDRLTHLIWENIPGSRVAWCAGAPTSPSGEIPDGRFLNLTGCPLDEMTSLVLQTSVFIGNDSGPMHLSAAVGNRVLAIFGPTAPERFGPWPTGAWNTASVRAPGGVLADLTAETVFENLEKLRSATAG